MSQTPPTPTSPRPATPPGDDPLAHLHRMSTTAGISSQEYVAINPWSVAAIVFGIASALTLLTKFLLFLPLAGLICGAIALRQIARSSGTQTGRSYALFGMAVALAFAVGRGAIDARSFARDRADARQISALIDQLWGHISKGEFQQAYDLHDDRFQYRVNPTVFQQHWKVILGEQANVSKIEWNGIQPHFSQGPDGSSRFADARVRIFLTAPDGSAGESADTLRFRLVDGVWKVNDFPTVFPPEKPAAGQ